MITRCKIWISFAFVKMAMVLCSHSLLLFCFISIESVRPILSTDCRCNDCRLIFECIDCCFLFWIDFVSHWFCIRNDFWHLCKHSRWLDKSISHVITTVIIVPHVLHRLSNSHSITQQQSIVFASDLFACIISLCMLSLCSSTWLAQRFVVILSRFERLQSSILNNLVFLLWFFSFRFASCCSRNWIRSLLHWLLVYKARSLIFNVFQILPAEVRSENHFIFWNGFP